MRKRRNIVLCLLSISFSLLLAACALPKIIVLEDPLSPQEHINLGVAYEEKGELDNAFKEYREASRKLPAAFLYMGNISFKKKEFSDAESYYKKAMKKDPKNADAYNNLAWLYYTEKRNLGEAEALAKKALDLNPSKGDIYRDTLDRIEEAGQSRSTPHTDR
jgi:tetratricopeptide (TPR) repeat protein